MKLPRDLAGTKLVKALDRLEYKLSHKTGSHIRLTTQLNGEHHVTVPAHDPIKIGTLNAIIRDIASHHNFEKNELIVLLFS
ncbi:type II toxin-antitoxin system HicA family toxin [Dolichospermum circinale CS-1225]|uniref:Type II toxin-antitoxin system HicA family toxin n=1 Tax=Dolichospermum circinale CS-537/01 TaxID=3021739 RepID=A0ABT5A5E2_9CYAN|nr:type II toxin-antitoxin system HicA family toxin [Dolichospermum circinale]MDB9459561.1 type II toxin-antitoxin system HicA family toxin [Dolichospermum circinale CS-545/17]MDB9453139.1 type II toxin-antitoxin system HicA family toxin [Dolichospermum circinale CS-541/06]MDB9464568.1 type II toxin-antitoxin system HicA family toxin [Dolichospermum circinale CS-541/04]MDB9467680.1 type II toxin-antitoxin system HicA family toxin [Dolichospermum circinale CS-539/09]MDB9471233.1 type II toxin-a